MKAPVSSVGFNWERFGFNWELALLHDGGVSHGLARGEAVRGGGEAEEVQTSVAWMKSMT